MTNSILIQMSPDNLKQMISDAVTVAIADLHNENSKKYLTIDDLCKMFHVTPQTINNWVNSRLLKAYKISDRTLFLSKEVDEAVIEKKIGKYKHSKKA